jgi:HK97 family phage major capsid protein
VAQSILKEILVDQQTLRQKADYLRDAANKAWNDLNAGRISQAKFDEVMDNCEAEQEHNQTLYKSRVAANRFGGGPDEFPGGWAGVQTKGSPPSLALDSAQMKAMFEKACNHESFSTQVRNKDTIGFNSGIGAQLPAQLAPYITRAIHERRLMDRLPTTACDAPSYEILQHTSTTGAAAVVAEGAPKPFVQLNLTHITLPMVKLAANTAVSWETISDYDRFVSYMTMEMPLQVVDVENAQLLYGSGSGGNMTGLFNTSGILTHAAPGVADYTALDAVEESIEQLRSGPALAEPDLFVISPSSWSALRRVKDTLNRYMLSPDPTSAEAMQLWGVPVLVTTQCNPGDGFLIDTTKMGHVIVRKGSSLGRGMPTTTSSAT